MKKGIIIASQEILNIIKNEKDIDIINNRTLKDSILITLQETIISKIDDVRFLMEGNRFDSLEEIARSVLELYCILRFILKEDSDKRATAFFYTYKIQAGEKIRRSIDKINDNYPEKIRLSEKEVEALKSEVSDAENLDDYIHHYREKYRETTGHEGRINTDKWYDFVSNVNLGGVRDLMKYVGMDEAMYLYFYSLKSMDIHGISNIGKNALDATNLKEELFNIHAVMKKTLTYYLLEATIIISKHYGLIRNKEIRNYIQQIKLNAKLAESEWNRKLKR